MLEGDELSDCLRLMEALDDQDDVVEVWTNLKESDE
jgi:transcriptional/translational regulatory protein YebC/TACO1